MLKKILFLISIFSACSTPELIQFGSEVAQSAVRESIKNKLEVRENTLNLENIPDSKRKVGDKWIDSNGKRWVQRDGFKMEFSELELQQFTGWWVYGEGQHIFKDEQTLDEYDLIFPNENMDELVELYVSVCEMEYFPMECQMTGVLSGSILSVQEFEILYIQGCGE